MYLLWIPVTNASISFSLRGNKEHFPNLLLLLSLDTKCLQLIHILVLIRGVGLCILEEKMGKTIQQINMIIFFILLFYEYNVIFIFLSQHVLFIKLKFFIGHSVFLYTTTMSINIQEIAHNIVILVNDKEAPTSRPLCCFMNRPDIYTSIRLCDHQIELINETNLFIVNPVFAMDDKTNEDILIDSIEKTMKLSPKLDWFTWFMKESIPISTFTIFINNNENGMNGVNNGIMNSPTFHPLSIATVDLVDIDNVLYLYVHTLCNDEDYTNGEAILMDTIKMIALMFSCEEVRIENLEKNYDYSWLKNHEFTQYTKQEIIAYHIEEDLEKYSYTYYYRVAKSGN